MAVLVHGSRRDDPTIQAFLVLAGGVVVWSGGRLLEISSLDLPGRIFWAEIQYFGIVAVPIGWLVAMVHLSRPRYVVPWSLLSIPILAAVLSVVLVLTNSHHHLVWTRITLMPRGRGARGRVRAWRGLRCHGGLVIPALLALGFYFLVTAEVPNDALSRRGRAVLAGSPAAAAGPYCLSAALDRAARRRPDAGHVLSDGRAGLVSRVAHASRRHWPLRAPARVRCAWRGLRDPRC
ncbi:histidine kinase N-terminal 7TM domain-containing protein [Cupriavidus basilensis]